MKTAAFVRDTAEVVRVISLQPGDVYKRVITSNYGGEAELRFGVVQSIMSNGDDSALTALEFTASYSGVKPDIKVWSTEQDLSLFAATPAEILEHFQTLNEAADKAVRDAERALAEARSRQISLRAATSTKARKALSAPMIARGHYNDEQEPTWADSGHIVTDGE